MRIDCHTHGDPSLARDPRAYVSACRQRGIEAIVLIEPLERCLQAVERWERQGAIVSSQRRQEYTQLLEELRGEIEAWLEVMEAGSFQSRETTS